MVEFLENNYLLVIILCAIILAILVFGKLILYKVAKGELKALKPVIKELIIRAEIFAQDEEMKKAGSEKLADVVKSVKLILANMPKPISYLSNLIDDDDITKFCEEVFQSFSDRLVIECENYRQNFLTKSN